MLIESAAIPIEKPGRPCDALSVFNEIHVRGTRRVHPTNPQTAIAKACLSNAGTGQTDYFSVIVSLDKSKGTLAIEFYNRPFDDLLPVGNGWDINSSQFIASVVTKMRVLLGGPIIAENTSVTFNEDCALSLKGDFLEYLRTHFKKNRTTPTEERPCRVEGLNHPLNWGKMNEQDLEQICLM